MVIAWPLTRAATPGYCPTSCGLPCTTLTVLFCLIVEKTFFCGISKLSFLNLRFESSLDLLHLGSRWLSSGDVAHALQDDMHLTRFKDLGNLVRLQSECDILQLIIPKKRRIGGNKPSTLAESGSSLAPLQACGTSRDQLSLVHAVWLFFPDLCKRSFEPLPSGHIAIETRDRSLVE